MYDYSKLNRIYVDEAITDINIREMLSRISLFSDIDVQSSSALSTLFAPTLNSEFCISGTLYAVKPILTSPGVSDNFLYVQNFGLMSTDSSYYTKRSNVESYMILYTLSGKGMFEYGGKQYYLERGDGVFIDCSRPHFYKTNGEEWTHSVIHFNGAGASAYYKEYDSYHKPVFHQPLDSKLQQLSEELVFYYSNLQPSRDVLISNTLSNILTYLITNTGMSDGVSERLLDYISRTIEYMESHYTDELSLDMLAEYAHTSKYHFSREFSKLTGFSPIEYVIQLRLNQAEALLICTDLPANKIAEQVGIPNEQYFGKLFKKRTGLTPGQFRKKQSQ